MKESLAIKKRLKKSRKEKVGDKFFVKIETKHKSYIEITKIDLESFSYIIKDNNGGNYLVENANIKHLDKWINNKEISKFNLNEKNI